MPYMDEPPLTESLTQMAQIRLERLKIQRTLRIPSSLQDVRITVRDHCLGEFIEGALVDMSTYIYGERLAPQMATATTVVTFTKPATWWEHWKHDHRDKWYARWIIRRWPVRLTTVPKHASVVVEIERFRTFPDLSIRPAPNILGSDVVLYMRTGATEWTVDGIVGGQ